MDFSYPPEAEAFRAEIAPRIADFMLTHNSRPQAVRRPALVKVAG